MHKIFLVKLTSQITCQWMVIERYKLSAHCVHFYIEKWMNFLVFYSQTFFDHISLVFHYFEQFCFLNDRCIPLYGQVRMGCFRGVWSPPPPPPLKKGYPFLGLSKLTKVFGNLKYFKWSKILI